MMYDSVYGVFCFKNIIYDVNDYLCAGVFKSEDLKTEFAKTEVVDTVFIEKRIIDTVFVEREVVRTRFVEKTSVEEPNVENPIKESFIQIGFVSPLGTNGRQSGSTINKLSFNVLGGNSYGEYITLIHILPKAFNLQE